MKPSIVEQTAIRCRRLPLWIAAVCLGLGQPIPRAAGTGQYALAFWREVGAYENQAPPAGQFGNHSAFVHVWDETGQPLVNKQIYTSWGVLLGASDVNGYVEIELRRPNGYDFQIRDGAHASDTTPVLSVERAPSWGHYSFEIGFLFKQQATNAGVFDTNHFGTINASGGDPCLNLSAPHTRSLAYYSTAASNYCSDPYALGNWTDFHGQSFVATGNRVIAIKAFLAAGFGVSHYWTAQILEGGPDGVAIGPPRSTRVHLDSEYYPLLVKWGANEVPVVPGRTYFLKVSRPGGINAWRLDRNNYALGNYYEGNSSVPGAELMGLVVCGTFTNSGPSGTLAGYVRDAASQPLSGALVSVVDTGLSASTAGDSSYAIPAVPVGTYDVSASRAGYLTSVNRGVVVTAGLTSVCNFTLQATNGTASGVTQPFESLPAWDSTFDAAWGNPAGFSLATPGQTGNALQAARSGAGSSARVQVLALKANTPYQLSLWMRSPSFASAYWAECAYKLGSNTAQNFDGSASSWTLVKKFSDTGVNGNGNVWTQYTTNFSSGTSTQLSVGFKLGANPGTGPTVQWDELNLVSLALPAVTAAVAESASNVSVTFAEPVNPLKATNASNYRLSIAAGAPAILEATLTNGTNVLLLTSPQAPRTDHSLTVSNITTLAQPPNLTGRNGQVALRAPFTLIALDEATPWKFEESGSDPGTAWRQPAFNDSAWPGGPALLGQACGALPEAIRTPLTTATNRTTFYFRHRFVLPPRLTNAWLRVRPVVDDGAVFWLNGSERLRLGMTSGTVTFATHAARTVDLAGYEGPFDLAGPSPVPGTNLFAVEVHQADPASSDVVFGASLEALVLPSQLPPTNALLSITCQADAALLSWAEPGLVLESATNVLGPWQTIPNVTNAANVPLTNTTMFFRLRW